MKFLAANIILLITIITINGDPDPSVILQVVQRVGCTCPGSSCCDAEDPTTHAPITEGNCNANNGTFFNFDGISYCGSENEANWSTTRDWCADMDMALAQPEDPIGLAAVMNNLNFGSWYFWLGAQGDGTNQVWLNGTAIPNNDSLWNQYNRNDDNTDITNCTGLITNATFATTPLARGSCATPVLFRLCSK